MAIVRTYECGDCSTKFDHLHWDRNEAPPECPGCKALAARQVPAGFSIGGNAAKAGDLTGRIMEEDYGISPRDINDRQRAGDIAVKIPAALDSQVKNFFKASGPVVGAAKSAAALSKAEGSNPLTILQSARKRTRGSNDAKVTCIPVAKA